MKVCAHCFVVKMRFLFNKLFIHYFSALDATGDKIGLAITQSLFLTATLQYGVRYSKNA